MVVITPGLAWTFMQEVPKLIEAMDPKGTTTVGKNAKVLNAVWKTAGTLTEAFKSPNIGDELKIKKGKEVMPINPGPKAPKGYPGPKVPKGDPSGVPKGTIEGINKGNIGEWGNSGLDDLRIGGAPNYFNTDDSLFYSLRR